MAAKIFFAALLRRANTQQLLTLNNHVFSVITKLITIQIYFLSNCHRKMPIQLFMFLHSQ